MLDINKLYLTYFLTSVFEAEALTSLSMHVSWALCNSFLRLKVQSYRYLDKESGLL
jgi:hypothetical protein